MGKGLISRKTSFGFIAGITSIGIDGIAGLIVLPMLIKFLSEEIAGIWLFFISFTFTTNSDFPPSKHHLGYLGISQVNCLTS